MNFKNYKLIEFEIHYKTVETRKKKRKKKWGQNLTYCYILKIVLLSVIHSYSCFEHFDMEK